MGPTPCYSQSQVVSVCQSFRPVAQLFFLAEYFSFFLFFGMEKGCGHIDMLKTFPDDTDYKYIYMGLWSNFNCSSMNPTMHRQTDRQTIRTL